MNQSLQERLGFSANDKILILHADDIGMCESTIRSWRELLDFGLITSASAMAPCPWFPAAAQFAKTHSVDLGLHLTLNCEWKNYRWGPLSGNEPATGLVDSTGYFHALAKPTHERATVESARKELQAQITRTNRFELDITHFDSHMLTLWHPKFMPLYIELSIEHGHPIFIPKQSAEEMARECSLPLEVTTILKTQLNEAIKAGTVIPIDSWHIFPFGKFIELDARLKWACDRLDEFAPGIHGLLCHPACDTPELKSLAPDSATRIGDHALFMLPEFRDEIRRRGFKLLGVRELQNLFRRTILNSSS